MAIRNSPAIILLIALAVDVNHSLAVLLSEPRHLVIIVHTLGARRILEVLHAVACPSHDVVSAAQRICDADIAGGNAAHTASGSSFFQSQAGGIDLDRVLALGLSG